jgi:hypothetical protein
LDKAMWKSGAIHYDAPLPRELKIW